MDDFYKSAGQVHLLGDTVTHKTSFVGTPMFCFFWSSKKKRIRFGLVSLPTSCRHKK